MPHRIVCVWDEASDAVKDQFAEDSVDLKADCEHIFDVLSQYGISEETASKCNNSRAVMGALSGLGQLLTDVRIQAHLFDRATKILANAGSGLRIGFEVTFLEWYLQKPFDLLLPDKCSPDVRRN